VIREPVIVERERDTGSKFEKKTMEPIVMHVDIIHDEFWQKYPQILK